VVYCDRIEGRPDSAPSSSLVTQSGSPQTGSVNVARRHGFDAVLRRLCLESTSISAQNLDSPSYATSVFIGGNDRFSLLTTRGEPHVRFGGRGSREFNRPSLPLSAKGNDKLRRPIIQQLRSLDVELLSKNPRSDFAVHIGEPQVSAAVRPGEFCVVESEHV
jgi:hypothetical protein